MHLTNNQCVIPCLVEFAFLKVDNYNKTSIWYFYMITPYNYTT